MSMPVSSLAEPLVLMVPYPLQSHITPLLQVARLLAARGFTVTFVLNEFNMKKMGEDNQALKASELNKIGITLVGIWDSVLEKVEANLVKEPRDMLECLPLLEQSFDGLVRKTVEEEGLTVACIISDAFLWGTQDVANMWRIPRVAFWPNSLTALACSISLPIISLASSLDPFKPQVYEGDKADVLTCIPGIPELDMCNLPFYTMGFAYNETWLRLNLEAQLARVNEPLCIISNSFLDLEREVHTRLQEILPSTAILALGPLLPSGFLDCQDHPDLAGTGADLLDADQDCIQWLDTQKPASVLYISMGSVAGLPERDIQEIALGLQASKQPFLWALRSPPRESALLPILHGQGKVVRWAPQLRVLSHKAVGGFFTHCGWNSTLESLSMGKPMIGIPIFMDQMTNCWFLVEELKVGVRLKLDESNRISHMGVEESIRMLMQECEGGHLLREHSTHFRSLAQTAYTTFLPFNIDTLVSMILGSSTSSLNPN